MKKRNDSNSLSYFPISGEGSFVIEKINKKGIKLMNYSQIVQNLLEIKDSYNNTIDLLRNFRYYDTGDAIINHPSGECLICLDSNELKKINKNLEIIIEKDFVSFPSCNNHDHVRKYQKNGWFLSKNEDEAEDIYQKVKKGVNTLIVSKKDLSFGGIPFTRNEALNCEIFKFLLRDKGLQKEFIDYTFDSLKEECHSDYGMPIFFDKCSKDLPEIGAIRLSNIMSMAYLIRAGNNRNRKYSFFCML